VVSVAATFLPVSVTLGYSMATVIEFEPRDTLTAQLQDDLCEVIRKEKYDDLRVVQVVGVLEFLKWNLINRSE